MSAVKRAAGSPAEVSVRPIVPESKKVTPLRIPSKTDFRDLRFGELELRLDEERRILHCEMLPAGRPCFTHSLLAEMGEIYSAIERAFSAVKRGDPTPFDYFVFGSRTLGIYNLGGDLAHFVKMARMGDLDAIRHYAHVCIDRQYASCRAFNSPVITIALVRGDALGGGFEHALSHDLIVAERSAKLGLPEVLFNLFPGMGAYSFISRKLDRRTAEKLITSGRVYSGEELHELGLVDVLAEDGEGEAALHDFIAQHHRKFNMRRAVYEARRLVNPVTLEELLKITDLWAETVMNLDERDLRIMERLYAAQDRRVAGTRSEIRAV
jgi:DSF synthase